MRIIHLVNHCNHGHGNAHVAIDLACNQAKRGDEVIYASAGGDYFDLLSRYGVRNEEIVQNIRNPFHFCSSLARLVRLVRSFKPDVIHAHMMAGAVFGYLTANLTRTPLVTTVHNSFDRHSIIMRLGDRVVAVSEAERKSLLEKGYKPNQVSVVINGPNCSPREDFLDRDRKFDHYDISSPSVATVCGLHQRKGVHDLIRGFEQATRTRPEWRLYIVGDGPDKEMLIQLAKQLNVQDKVKLLGSVGSPKKILEKSDIFVLASYADPCSLAVAEARAAGCAIVATSVGGTPELVEFGQAGRLVRPGQPSEIASELNYLMSDRQILQDWRERSKRGAGYYEVDRVVSDYEVIYKSLAH